MSPDHSKPAATSGPQERLAQETQSSMMHQETEGNGETDRIEPHVEDQNNIPMGSREVVRLFQCRVCSLPLKDAVTLPCGKSLCRKCLPQTHLRSSITYPALPDRLQGLRCPFEDCGRVHAAADCNIDVILNKVVSHAKCEVERGKVEALKSNISTQVVVLDPWKAAGMASLKEDESSRGVIRGDKLVAIWTLAEDGDLDIGTELLYRELPASCSESSTVLLKEETKGQGVLGKIRQEARNEMDCQVCYTLFFEPLTTGCGHTFCRSCLHRILDHSRYCPICRRKLAINPLLDRTSCPSNQAITNIIETLWGDEFAARQEALAAEAANSEELDVPLFVCTLSFPHMTTFLHVFEPRYRLMIRRALEGNRTFGMVLPKRPQTRDAAHFHDVGTLLRIADVQFYPDGRSLIETIGLSRFRVLRHGSLDGYIVCRTERIDDISLEEEEAMEAAEVRPEAGASDPTPSHDGNSQDEDTGEGSATGVKSSSSHPEPDGPNFTSVADMERMSTQDLMQFAKSFVTRMREQSAPWLTEQMFRAYGECPDDPAVFPWWFASILPVKDLEKYRLLETSSVRERLKICCSWIAEWNSSRWYPGPARFFE